MNTRQTIDTSSDHQWLQIHLILYCLYRFGYLSQILLVMNFILAHTKKLFEVSSFTSGSTSLESNLVYRNMRSCRVKCLKTIKFNIIGPHNLALFIKINRDLVSISLLIYNLCFSLRASTKSEEVFLIIP